MASSSSLNPFALKSLPTPTIRPHRNLSFPATVSASSFPSKKFPTLNTELASPSFVPRAVVVDDEGGKEKAVVEPEAGGVELAEAAAELVEDVVVGEVGGLKKKLKGLLHGTDRGLKASSETSAEIAKLITQLEAKSPTPAPTEALALLNGKWILAYTSFSQLFPLLGSGKLPELVKVDEISQAIDSEASTVQNSVKFAGPLAGASVTTNSKFEAQSPKLAQIKVEKGVISTPQLTDSIVFPDKVELLGQNIDLSPLKGVVSTIQDSYSSVAETISGKPPAEIPLTKSNAQSWMLTTYLDEELRISRGDGSTVFVLIKEGSPLLE